MLKTTIDLDVSREVVLYDGVNLYLWDYMIKEITKTVLEDVLRLY